MDASEDAGTGTGATRSDFDTLFATLDDHARVEDDNPPGGGSSFKSVLLVLPIAILLFELGGAILEKLNDRADDDEKDDDGVAGDNELVGREERRIESAPAPAPAPFTPIVPKRSPACISACSLSEGGDSLFPSKRGPLDMDVGEPTPFLAPRVFLNDLLRCRVGVICRPIPETGRRCTSSDSGWLLRRKREGGALMLSELGFSSPPSLSLPLSLDVVFVLSLSCR